MPPLTPAAQEQIDAAAIRASVEDLVAYLGDVLGERVAAYLAGAVDVASDVRLRTGYTVVRMIERCYDSDTAKAWLFGTNTRLGDRAPIEVLAQATAPEQLVDVRRAAHAFATAAA